jgi:hypothetical protein
MRGAGGTRWGENDGGGGSEGGGTRWADERGRGRRGLVTREGTNRLARTVRSQSSGKKCENNKGQINK